MAKIERSVIVNVPLRTAYNQWTQFEQFNKFMEGIREVRQVDDTHLHWKAQEGQQEKEWDSEIVEQVPDKCIAWRSRDTASGSGRVTFTRMDDNRTEINLSMEYGQGGEDPNDPMKEVRTRRIEGDLQRFKDFIEWLGRETGAWRGEVHGGQPHSGRTPETSVASSRGSSSGTSGGLPMHDEHFEPFGLFRRLWSEMDQMLEAFAGRTPALNPLRSHGNAGPLPSLIPWRPRADIARRGDKLIVSIDLPGLTRDDVKVHISEGSLVVEGDRRNEMQSDEGGGFRFERSYGHFYRSLPLPQGIDLINAKATMQNGLLNVVIPAPQSPHGRRLEIGTDESQSGSVASSKSVEPTAQSKELNVQAGSQEQPEAGSTQASETPPSKKKGVTS